MENSKYKNMSFPQVFGGNLPLSELLLKKEKQPCFMQKVEDPQQKLLGMTPNFTSGLHPTYNSNGFTLIELLVVVLIIGILAAVALPQYQKAVEKSRAAQALTLLKSVGNAFEAHHLASGAWADSFEELAVDIPFTGNTTFIPAKDVQETRSNNDWSLQLQQWNNYVLLIIGRISGKYKGAGFVIVYQTPDGMVASPKISCIERTSASSFLFDSSLSDGAYCSKIMQGTFNSQDTWTRFYDLPY